MLNKKLIEEAINIVFDYYAAEGIYEETRTVIERAKDWYTHTEITDPTQLAAVIISGPFEPGITYPEIEHITYFFFPEDSEEYLRKCYEDYLFMDNISVEELKDEYLYY